MDLVDNWNNHTDDHTVAASDPNSARREFLSYALSLMRSHNAEHADSLPVLDVSALRHVAYVFDALIYYMRSTSDQTTVAEELRDTAANNSDWIQQVPITPFRGWVVVDFSVDLSI